MISRQAICGLGLFLLAFSACGKKDKTAKAATPSSATKQSASPSDGKVAHIVLSGDVVVVPGMRLESRQTLKMSAGNFATASAAGSTQGAMTLVDTEVRDIELVSEREKKVVLTEKQTKVLVDTGDPEPAETTVKSELIGAGITAIRQKSGKWWYGLAEGEATIEELKELQDMGESDVLVVFEYPKEPVTLGEKWESDGEALKALFGRSFAVDEATVGFRMIGVKTHDGQRCAEVGIRIEASGSYVVGDGVPPVRMRADMEGTVLHSLNTFQDLRVALDGIVTLEHSPVEGTTVSADGTIEFVRENRARD